MNNNKEPKKQIDPAERVAMETLKKGAIIVGRKKHIPKNNFGNRNKNPAEAGFGVR